MLRHPVPPLYSVEDPAFARALSSLLGPPLIAGNRLTTLLNGDQIFPAMLEAIRGARRTITFESYAYSSGRIGQTFADALSERARAGVRVHVLLDWIGARFLERRLVKQMRRAGVQIELYNPPRWWDLYRLNYRTHRRLLVVDGRIGFTGGVGVADEWLGDADRPEHWRDTQVRVEGPAVAEMQGAFMDNWIKQTGYVLHGDDYFPPLAQAGNITAQVFRSTPNQAALSARLMYLLAIASARHSIRIANSYFVPDDLAVHALTAAAERGVRIEVICAGPLIDVPLARWASRARWGRLLKAGIDVYEYAPTMFHVKVMIVDDRFVSVGSINFDSRSFRLNDEANLNVLDERFAAEHTAIFDVDRAHSQRITLESWKRRPWREKVLDAFGELVHGEL